MLTSALKRHMLGSGAVWLVLIVALFACTTRQGWADPVAVRFPEGPTYGVVTLSSLAGAVLADGELIQTVRRRQVESRLVFHFKDGSLHDEVTVFTQDRVFRVVSYRLVERGSAFPHETEVAFDRTTGRYKLRFREKPQGGGRAPRGQRGDARRSLQRHGFHPRPSPQRRPRDRPHPRIHAHATSAHDGALARGRGHVPDRRWGPGGDALSDEARNQRSDGSPCHSDWKGPALCSVLDLETCPRLPEVRRSDVPQRACLAHRAVPGSMGPVTPEREMHDAQGATRRHRWRRGGYERRVPGTPAAARARDCGL